MLLFGVATVPLDVIRLCIDRTGNTCLFFFFREQA
jgi:hypothetical protein